LRALLGVGKATRRHPIARNPESLRDLEIIEELELIAAPSTVMIRGELDITIEIKAGR